MKRVLAPSTFGNYETSKMVAANLGMSCQNPKWLQRGKAFPTWRLFVGQTRFVFLCVFKNADSDMSAQASERKQ